MGPKGNYRCLIRRGQRDLTAEQTMTAEARCYTAGFGGRGGGLSQ